MQIIERRVGAVTILDLKGKMTLGEGDELLKDKINELIFADRKEFILRLDELRYVDAAGMAEIVRCYTTVARRGGKLKLLALSPQISGLLDITKLRTCFEIFEDENEAVRSFTNQPTAT